MENGPPTFGLEDGTTDVERLLVEPQDGHVSVDSVICFNEKISENAMDIKDVSCSFGRSRTGISPGEEDVINGEVLDATPGDDEVGYFRYHNDFCSMGEEYLLGYEFAESITNLDYGSSEGLEASIPDNKMEASSAGSDTASKSDIFGVINVPDFQNDQFDFESSELSKISSCHEQEMSIEEKPSISPRSHTLKNHEKLICHFQDILSAENDGRLSEKVHEFELTGQNGQSNIFRGQDALAIVSVQESSSDVLPSQKRSRKPTQRYIDELTDPIPTYSKKRREVTSSAHNRVRKSLGIKDHKKCDMGSKAIQLPAEESSVPAIQVPFGSLVHKECPETHAYDVVRRVNSGNLVTKTKGKRVTPENKRKRDECITTVSIKRRDEGAAIPKLPAAAAHLKKKDGRITARSLMKRNDCSVAIIPKKKDDHFTAENPEDLNGKRKHHRLWTIAEVRKLIDGVSQYGVGRWSRIKKLFFSTSAHRTSVDLKDKWRNLLKASGIQEHGNREGEKKRNMAWRPLPKSILRRVCELASMHPYPKGEGVKIAHNINYDSPERTADITLSDYRRILRSINGN